MESKNIFSETPFVVYFLNFFIRKVTLIKLNIINLENCFRH